MSTRILLTGLDGSARQDLEAYRQRGGYEALRRAVDEGAGGAVLEAVAAAGLRGRGGASFPVARKWGLAAAQDRDGGERYVVANGGEHEPGSDKDKYLVAHYPHAVLEGMALCGLATGARVGYLYLIEDMQAPLAAAQDAIAEAEAAGVLGGEAFEGRFAFEIRIHRAPTTYVAGEETAALESIEGRPALPRAKPPYPGEAGLFGRPTTVNNVETLAHVPWIVRHGADAYRAIGTEGSAGTMLFTLGERVARPGVYELPFGATFRELIYGCGGGPRSGRPLRAILPALSCRFLAAEHLDTPMDHARLAELGGTLGCGGVSFVEEGEDPLPRILEIAQFFMDEQCGQCPPCRMETNQMVHVLRGVADGRGPGYAEKLQKLAAFARGKGRCSLIEMAAAPVLSALELFADDLARAAGSSG